MEPIIQGTPEWYAIRCGKVTASKIADMMARTKTGWSASRANYQAQIVAERLTGNVERGYVSAEMAWGSEKEADARNTYEFLTDLSVEEVGFVDHALIPMSGASPDGLVADDGLIEIKCPNTATHIDTLLGQSVPGRYVQQMQWQMACTGRAWCDFVSYDPRLPVDMQIFIRRIERDDAAIEVLEGDVQTFLAEVAQTVERLRALSRRAAA